MIRDGARDNNGSAWGTYIHDIFKNDEFRRELINYLRQKKGLDFLKEKKKSALDEREKNYNQFAELVKNNIDINEVFNIIFA
jgi:adenosylcobyric acid synthase